jgi:hypothetical protein
MITESELIGEVRQQAHAEPARVYKKFGVAAACLYRPGTTNPLCGCIVGEALSALGVPEEVLRRLDGADTRWDPTFGSPVGWGADEATGILGEYLAAEAIGSPWVIEVQGNQDQGMTWEDAVEAADVAARRHGWVMA